MEKDYTKNSVMEFSGLGISADKSISVAFHSSTNPHFHSRRPIRNFCHTTFPLHFYKSRANVFCRSERGIMPPKPIELPQGTLDLLILRTLALGAQHGWAIAERVQQISSDVLRIQQGSLYPALHRLERRGWIKARWGTSDNNRRAKFYELTKTGLKQLEAETDAWQKLTAAVGQVLKAV